MDGANEFRVDPITGLVVIISPGRSARPTDFAAKKQEIETGVTCPFCAGNESQTPPTITFRGPSEKEWAVRCFENKFSALDISGGRKFGWKKKEPLFISSPAVGAHEVVVESRDHGISMASLSPEQIALCLEVYKERFDALSRKHPCVFAFQNYGKEGGASLSHLHAQIAAFPFVPEGVQEKIDGSARYRKKHGKCPYCDMVRKEKKIGERLVLENDDFAVICPWASAYKYQTMIVPKKHTGKYSFPLASLADAMKRLLGAYQKVLGEFPYNYIVYAHPKLHFHIDFLPKLSLHAGVEKGAEIYINSTRPEDAAKELRNALKA
jgi:UDPglucose--hexose-1-phosphate uridylyltransferase